MYNHGNAVKIYITNKYEHCPVILAIYLSFWQKILVVEGGRCSTRRSSILIRRNVGLLRALIGGVSLRTWRIRLLLIWRVRMLRRSSRGLTPRAHEWLQVLDALVIIDESHEPKLEVVLGYDLNILLGRLTLVHRWVHCSELVEGYNHLSTKTTPHLQKKEQTPHQRRISEHIYWNLLQ